MLAQGCLEVAYQLYHVFLVLFGEVFGYVEFAERFAEHGVGDSHGAFPAGFLFLLAAHGTVEHLEVGVPKVVAEQVR